MSARASSADREVLITRIINAPRDLVLNREHVRGCTVKTFSPNVLPGRSGDQLSSDAKLLSGTPDAPLQYIVDAKFVTNLFNVSSAPLKCKARIARDDK